MHQLEALVDLLERERVCDHGVDLDLALHVPVDDLRYVGAAARSAEGRALPDAPGDKLEWTGGDFLACAGHADDDRLAPAAMRRFQRLAHDGDVARAVEGVIGPADRVGAALRHVDEIGHEVAFHLLRVDEMRHAEALSPFLLGVVDVDADNHVGPGQSQALDDVEPDAAEPEDDGGRAYLDLGGVDDGADAGGHAAADVADLVERRVRIDLGHRDFR